MFLRLTCIHCAKWILHNAYHPLGSVTRGDDAWYDALHMVLCWMWRMNHANTPLAYDQISTYIGLPSLDSEETFTDSDDESRPTAMRD